MNILEQAIKMEKDGEAYYKKQAEENKDNSLYNVCMMLAEEEKIHAEILSSKMKNLPYSLEESSIYEDAKNIFAAADDFKSEIKDLPSQLDFYRFALDNEQKSIDMYEEYGQKAEDEKEKGLFSFLAKQEKDHFALIDELVKLLTNAEQWVESAEFGIRDKY